MKPTPYTPEPTTIIWQAISSGLQMAQWLNRDILLHFNQHRITITPTDDENTVCHKLEAMTTQPRPAPPAEQGGEK